MKPFRPTKKSEDKLNAYLQKHNDTNKGVRRKSAANKKLSSRDTVRR